jgi:hypothetical protein
MALICKIWIEADRGYSLAEIAHLEQVIQDGPEIVLAFPTLLAKRIADLIGTTDVDLDEEIDGPVTLERNCGHD